MDSLQFIASLVSSLAWPLAVVVVTFLLRKPIGELIKRVGHVKAGPLEAWTAVEAEVDVAVAASSVSGAEIEAGGPLSARLAEVAQREPITAVKTAWAELDKALRAKMAKAGLREAPMSGLYTTLIAVQIALDGGAIDEKTATAMRGLATLRGLAQQEDNENGLQIKAALDFLTLADAVMFAVELGTIGK